MMDVLETISQDMDLPEKKGRVVVAMSGGVDSSVVAAVLADIGYDVVGMTLQLYDHGMAMDKKKACCSGQDIYDAKRVAQQIGFPHYVLNYERRFKDQVIEDFAESYMAGETPVPCIKCNQTVKFTDLLHAARSLGADAMATGHYVQRKRLEGEKSGLYRGKDTDRDQSYFLFATHQEQLDFLRFPLGALHKGEVRELARKYNLKIAEKRDSQDICFVPSGHYSDVIEKLKPEAVKSGEIVHMDGRILGKHSGVFHYTVGQRRNLGIAMGEALYVLRLDAKKGQVIVGPKAALLRKSIMLREVNWLGEGHFDRALSGLSVWVRIRSMHAPKKGQFSCSEGGEIKIILDEETGGVAPGQACVFYENADSQARVLGGGWICKESG